MRGFHDLLRQKPTSLFILLGWSLEETPLLCSYCWDGADIKPHCSVHIVGMELHIPEDGILHSLYSLT
jgi:hypothetical protein